MYRLKTIFLEVLKNLFIYINNFYVLFVKQAIFLLEGFNCSMNSISLSFTRPAYLRVFFGVKSSHHSATRAANVPDKEYYAPGTKGTAPKEEEPLETVPKLCEPFPQTFNAIGKITGREIAVYLAEAFPGMKPNIQMPSAKIMAAFLTFLVRQHRSDAEKIKPQSVTTAYTILAGQCVLKRRGIEFSYMGPVPLPPNPEKARVSPVTPSAISQSKPVIIPLEIEDLCIPIFPTHPQTNSQLAAILATELGYYFVNKHNQNTQTGWTREALAEALVAKAPSWKEKLGGINDSNSIINRALGMLVTLRILKKGTTHQIKRGTASSTSGSFTKEAFAVKLDEM